MKGDTQVIDYLNKALTNELTAINQYWLHYRVLKNWGIEKLAEYERHESIDEMKRSEEHTSELQSQSNLVCRLLLEKKNKKTVKTRTRAQNRYAEQSTC